MNLQIGNLWFLATVQEADVDESTNKDNYDYGDDEDNEELRGEDRLKESSQSAELSNPVEALKRGLEDVHVESPPKRKVVILPYVENDVYSLLESIYPQPTKNWIFFFDLMF